MRNKTGAAVGVVAWCLINIGCRFLESDPAEELDAALRRLRYRPIEARLSGVPYAPPPPSSFRAHPSALLDSKGAIHLGLHFASLPRPHTPSTLESLFRCDRAGAARQLARVTAGGAAPGTTWSDYAAVLHAHVGSDDPMRLLTALAAIEHALDRDPDLPEALFNRGLVLEELSFRTAAAKAYDRYLVVDRSSPWANEARKRSGQLRAQLATVWRPTFDSNTLERAAEAGNELLINDVAITHPVEARRFALNRSLEQWADRVLSGDASSASRLTLCRIIGRSLEAYQGDSLLADIVRAIDAAPDQRPLAQAHLSRRHAWSYTPAQLDVDAMREALKVFAAHDSPMALVIRYEIATANGPDLRVELNTLMRVTPARYRRLTALLQQLQAGAFAADGLITDAVKSYRRAYELYTTLGEVTDAILVQYQLSALLMNQGDVTAAWRLRLEALARTADTGNEKRLESMIRQTAIDAVFEKRWAIGHALLKVYF